MTSIIYALFQFVAVLALVLLIVKFLPPITRVKKLTGRNARNTLLFITMNENLGRYASAIWAQEYFESLHKKKHLIQSIKRKDAFLRDMELMGHEIEVQVAARMGTSEKDYRRSEARAIAQYEQFMGEREYTEDEIYTDMLSKRTDAIAFVNKHRDKIQKAKQYE